MVLHDGLEVQDAGVGGASRGREHMYTHSGFTLLYSRK